MGKKILRQGFLLSLLLHILLIVSMIKFVTSVPVPVKEFPHVYTPAYVYTGAVKPITHYKPIQSPTSSHMTQASQNSQTSPAVKPAQDKVLTQKKNGLMRKSILEMSRDVLQQDQLQAAMNASTSEEPMLLIGDTRHEADPFVRSLGLSLSRYFIYPKLEGTMGMRGRVVLGLVIHPEGYFSDVKIIRSSNNQDFDNAALYAVNKAPPVVGAEHYLSEPKYIVVGYIFD